MSQRNQEAKRVYMLKDNIFLKDEQLKRKKKTDNENDLCSLEVAITLCYLCIKLMMFVCRIFSTYIGTNVHVLLYGTLYRQFNAS